MLSCNAETCLWFSPWPFRLFTFDPSVPLNCVLSEQIIRVARLR